MVANCLSNSYKAQSQIGYVYLMRHILWSSKGGGCYKIRALLHEFVRMNDDLFFDISQNLLLPPLDFLQKEDLLMELIHKLFPLSLQFFFLISSSCTTNINLYIFCISC